MVSAVSTVTMLLRPETVTLPQCPLSVTVLEMPLTVMVLLPLQATVLFSLIPETMTGWPAGSVADGDGPALGACVFPVEGARPLGVAQAELTQHRDQQGSLQGIDLIQEQHQGPGSSPGPGRERQLDSRPRCTIGPGRGLVLRW